MNAVIRSRPDYVASREVYRGHEGLFRLPHRCEWRAVQKDGVPQVYASSIEAKLAAYDELFSALFRDIVSTGHKTGNTRSEAERLFGCIFRKGRRIEVGTMKTRRMTGANR